MVILILSCVVFNFIKNPFKTLVKKACKMGRRSINTTKSGKYMNPTDQARKEARKKELKKNKKQRQMVRQAVLKGKDPSQLLEEMEKIDEMEYNVLQPSPLNEKVLKEKRKKLKETLDRVMRLYHTDEPELWAEMKRKEVEYEKRRFKRVQYYDSVRTAEQVQIDDIPLPSSTDKPSVPTTLPKISLPPPILLTNVPPPTLLRKPEESTFDSKSAENKEKQPPGPPPSVPVDLFAMRELDSDYESDGGRDSDSEDDPVPKKSKTSKFSDDKEKEADETDVKGPNTVQQKMLSLSGQNIDDFMKEMENVQKKKEEERALDIKRIDPIPDVEESIEKPEIDIPKPAALIEPVKPKESIPMPQSLPPPVGLPRLPPALMFRPPPMRPSMPQMAIRMPPAPPPRPNLGMGMPRMGIRMPPGPPLGPPPSRHAPKHHHHHHHDRNAMQSAPQISKDPKSATIITAKPQIRNLSADVTRFLPTTLRTKRDETKKPKPRSFIQEQQRQQQLMSHAVKGPTKDDAYAEFMNQMQGFL